VQPDLCHLRAAWVAGPDAGHTVLLPPGRHLVGRAPACPVRCDDPALAAHHGVLEVACDATWTWTRWGGSATIDGGDPRTVHLGDSLLRLTTVDGTCPPRHPGRVHRPPRAVRTLPVPSDPPNAAVPHATPEGIAWSGLVPSLLGIAAALVMALATGQAMFAVFGVIGSAVGVATWAVAAVADRRRTSRARAAHVRAMADDERHRRQARQQVVDQHRADVTDLADALDIITSDDDRLWQRRPHHPDAFTVALGAGEVCWPDHLVSADAHERGGFDGTVTVTLGPGVRVAVRGGPDTTHHVAAALAMQLLAQVGPADLRLMIVTREPDRWAWLHDAPHARGTGATPAVIGEAEVLATADLLRATAPGVAAPHLVVLTDDPDGLVARTAPLRRLVEHDPAPALVVLVTDDRSTPHVCTAELTVDDRSRGRWLADTADHGLPAMVHVARLQPARATRVLGSLACCVDPEVSNAAGGSLPATADLFALLGDPDPAAIAIGWQRAGADPPPSAVVGVAAHPDAGVEPVVLDLAIDGPHALVAGTTGAGKSELLRTWVLSLAVANPPDALQFVLVDFKGGAAFDALAGLPHVAGTVTDLDGNTITRCIHGLDAEVRRRERVLREHRAGDLTELRRCAAPQLARLVVVIDEFAVLARERPDDLAALVDLARRGRSLGMHLVLATQRPAGVVTDDIRANTALRIALRLHDHADAVDVVDDAGPAHFARSSAGRAMIRLGDDSLTVQAAHCPHPAMLVDRIREAAATSGTTTADAIWLPPLPDAISWRPGRPVGVCDDPAGRRTVDLHQPADAHLLLVGPPRDTGITIDTVVRAARWRGDDVFVVATRRTTGPAGGGATGASVVAADDGERRLRLLQRLAAGTRTPTVLVIAGVQGLLAAIGDDHHGELELVSALLRADPAAGDAPRLVVAAEHPNDLPLAWTAMCPDRWVFRLADPCDGAALGVHPTAMPAGPQGRCAVVHPGTPTLAAQVARWDGELHLVDTSVAPTPAIDVLPDRVDDGELAGSGGTPVLGLAFDDLAPLAIGIDADTPVTVLGPPRSGRSTVLGRLVAEWERTRPDGHVTVLAPRRTSLVHPHLVRTVDELIGRVTAAPPGADVLVAVDDADLLDDPRLSDAVTHPATTVVITATPDGLRHTYGHWSVAVRRSRVAVIWAGCDRLDGDLVGATLPRRPPIAPRPGLAWVVEHGVLRLVQVALPPPPRPGRRHLAVASAARAGRGR